MIGNNGYIGRQRQINLFETEGIELEGPLKKACYMDIEKRKEKN